MNRVSIIGNLTKKPELKYTTNNMAVSKFTIAINRIKEGTDYINCVVFGKQAENLCNYMDKGNKIAIDGRIQTSTYDKQDGTKGYITEVVAQTIEFLNGKKQEAKEEVNEDPFTAFSEIIETDDNFLE